MSIATLILQAARRLPDNPAVTDVHGTTTYATFADRAARMAGGLRARGIPPGGRVVLYMENTGAFFESLLACWIAGLCAVPVNAKLHPREVAGIAADAGAELLFTTPGLADAMAAEAQGVAGLREMVCAGTAGYARLAAADPIDPPDAAPDTLAWLFYTSGTTGKPKGAMLSHRNLLAMSLAYYADIDPVDERDTHIACAPVSHGAGLYALPFLLKGGHQIVLPGFDVEDVLDALTRYENVSLFAAPTMLTRLINHPATLTADLANLKTIYYGGAPMYVADLKQALRMLGPKLCQIYGQGESPMTITALPKGLHVDAAGHPAAEEVLASCGFPRSGQEVRVVDQEGRDLPPGEVGEVITRGDCVMGGYWNNSAGTAAALRGGWLYTGDVGSLDARGYLVLRDRSKDLIISGGSNIYPREVEEVLLRHEGVLEVSVIGAPHPDWGEEVVAFVVSRPGARVDAGALDQLCLDNIARFKRPKRYRFEDVLPKNNYGKILKTELRRRLADEAGGVS
ncbi:AMP-binding protein [Xanthobacter dioxanivorans]|uniref:3-methylmercaptopropionyl-CoA ligase n=1 Tax=Xanthobacter dioxanivorans TaxID=2528964 RepID=A0A974PT54_9HYPH|nr:AMP-binding protein [Xanthobacter dioxanivorans]QRG09327.1 AMP-binding protein [Xanthobacter dioxanivorans]